MTSQPIRCLLTAATFVACSSATTPAAEKHQRIELTTADGVNLAAYYRPGTQGNKSPAVLVLDGIGANRRPKVCDAIAIELNKLGCATLCFDFRGNGASKGVAEEFWHEPTNRALVRGYKVKGGPEQIEVSDFKPGYFRALVNDVAAARAFLDLRNDAGECNTGQLMVVGIRDGASVGALWVATEWSRYRLTGGFNTRLAPNPEGRDILGCLWVDPLLEMDRQKVPMTECLKRATAKRSTEIALFHTADDTAMTKWARQCSDAMNKKSSTLFHSTPLKIDRGDSVTDAPALVATLATAVKTMLEGQDPPPWDDRDFVDKRYAWSPPSGALVLAKEEDERTLKVVPLDRLLPR